MLDNISQCCLDVTARALQHRLTFKQPIDSKGATTMRNTTNLAHQLRASASRKWLRRIGGGILLLLVGLGLGGFTYEQIAAGQSAEHNPPPGMMVDAGSLHLHLHSMGEANGQPTVILEAGNGGFSAPWIRVQTALAATTRVVAYDRAGLGWSENSREPRNAITAATQLHNALTNAGIEGPYILVGHSMGGLFVRGFAHQYPAEVAGVVLVDAAHPDAFARYPATVEQTQVMLRRLTNGAAVVAPLGLFRLTGPLFAEGLVDLPAEQAAQSHAVAITPRHVQALRDEYNAWFPSLNDQVRQTGDLGNRPLIVLSASAFPGGAPAPEGYWEAHFAMQQELAALSSNGELRVIEGATHYSLITSPTDAHHTITAIQEVLNSIR
jgi:pimeloyl-ACP methyl ester carboxylesterase